VGDLSSDSFSAAATKNKELGHIPDSGVARDLRALFDENQARIFVIELNKEGMTGGVRPIERKGGVAEPAIVTDVQGEKLAEVVSVQFQEVG
jgi:hypothetical protein